MPGNGSANARVLDKQGLIERGKIFPIDAGRYPEKFRVAISAQGGFGKAKRTQKRSSHDISEEQQSFVSKERSPHNIQLFGTKTVDYDIFFL